MKVLLDTCISAKAVEVVRQAGHDVVWSGDRSADQGPALVRLLKTYETELNARGEYA